MYDNNIHILALSETWLTPLISSSSVSIPEYSLVRNDRNLQNAPGERYIQGGGVACYIHKSLEYKVLKAPQINSLNETEFIMLDIRNKSGTKLFLSAIYRRPKGFVLNDFFNDFQSLSPNYDHSIIVGDLNSHLDTSNFHGRSLTRLIDESNLCLLPTGPSYHTDQVDSWLDVVIVDSIEKVLSYLKSPVPFIANHDYIILNYKFSVNKFTGKTVTFRDFKHCDLVGLKNTIARTVSLSTDLLSDSSNHEVSLDNFYEGVTSALNMFAPLITREIRRPLAPWLTPDIKEQIRERDRMYKTYKRNRIPQFLLDYKRLRKQIKHLIRQAKQNYYENSLSDIRDPSKLWRFLSKLGLTASNPGSSADHFSLEELVQHYSAISSTHPPCSQEQLNQILLIPIPPDSPKFSFALTDCVEVQLALKSCLLKAKGRSPDGLPLKCIADAIPILAPFLSSLFNSSIDTCIYPSRWKRAFVVPLNKISLPLSPSDTRPISNLAHLAKVFDSIISHQIVEYLENNSLLSQHQSGFRRHFSTQTALLRIMDDVRLGVERGMVTILLLFDFTKAFDSIDHCRLLHQLRLLGFTDDSLKLLHSYLSGRSMAVVDSNDHHSAFHPCSSGVPQGSIPGPIIFIMYINSILQELDHCRNGCMLFADDLQIYLHCLPSEIPDAIARLNGDAAKISNWSSANGLSLNASKTKAILLGSTQNLMRINLDSLPNIVINGSIIPLTSTVKNLGIHISSDLTWNAHVSQVSRRVHGVLHKLRFKGDLLPLSIRKILVNSLVLPHFDYACLVYNDLTDYLDTKLNRLLNTCIRYVFRIRRDTPIAPYRRQLGWLSLQSRRKYFLGITIYRILASANPTYLYEPFVSIFSHARRPSRREDSTFAIPLCTTKSFEKSFVISAAKFWDTLPINIKNSPSIETFKVQLHNLLITHEY